MPMISDLSDYDLSLELAVIDDSGIMQPLSSSPQYHTITEKDADNHGDYEGRVGEVVLLFHTR